jgi:hypothetical protein
MKSRLLCVAAMAAFAVVPASGAIAAPADPVSSLALPTVGVFGVAPDAAPVAFGGGFAQPPPSSDGTQLESIRYYRPRSRRPRYDYEDRSSRQSSSGYMQIHGGFFDPSGDVANGMLFGVRLGTSIDDRVQLGVSADWAHRSDRQSQVIGTASGPGGTPVTRQIDLAKTSSDLFPLLVFLQVAPGGSAGPYFGVAGGYEALFLSAEDFTTHQNYDATYDGWGWQAYAGFAIPLASRSRFNVEGFINNGELDRDVEDAGLTYREIVKADGGGLRAGFSWSF